MGFFEELKRRRVVRVLLAYGAIAFAVGQAATSFFPALHLPAWSVTLVVALCLLGFPVAAVLAWAFDVTDQGIVRTDDAPRGAQPMPRSRRAIAGVVIALCIGLGVFLALRRDNADAAIDDSLIAVLPFRVAGSDPQLAYLREGMVDLLASALSVEQGTRAVDPRSAISAWRRQVEDAQLDLSPDSALLVGRALGAGRVLLGSVVGTPLNVTLIASIYAVDKGNKTVEARVLGSADTVQSLIDNLTAQLLSLEAGESRNRLASLTSTSLEAVKEYLLGQSLYRRARFAQAATRFNRAIDIDSTFALAALGLRLTQGWGTLGADVASNLSRTPRLIRQYRDRFTAADREFAFALAGESSKPRPIKTVLEQWNGVITRNPDRADAWFQYADVLMHQGRFTDPQAWPQARDAFNKTLALDSSYTPALVHLLDYSVFADPNPGEFKRLASILARQPVSADVAAYQYWERIFVTGDSVRIREFRAQIDTMPFVIQVGAAFTSQLGGGTVDDAVLASEASVRNANSPEEKAEALELAHYAYMNLGRLDDARRMMNQGLQSDAAMFWRGQALLNAMFWDGDTAFAAVSADALAASFLQLPKTPPSPAVRDAACRLAQWQLRLRVTRDHDRLLALIETPDGENYPRPADELCATLLRALHATALNSPNASAAIQRLDSITTLGHGTTPMLRQANATLAQLYDARGDTRSASRVQQRMGGSIDMQQFLSVWKRERGRLALLEGDTVQAIREWTQYLELQAKATGHNRQLVDELRQKLAAITGERRR